MDAEALKRREFPRRRRRNYLFKLVMCGAGLILMCATVFDLFKTIKPRKLSRREVSEFYARKDYHSSIASQCDPFSYHCLCTESWSGSSGHCDSLARAFDSAADVISTDGRRKEKVLLRVDPRWEYIDEFPPGMYDCARSLCSVDLKTNAGASGERLWETCSFVTIDQLKDVSYIEPLLEEDRDCVFGRIIAPECLKLVKSNRWAQSVGLAAGMMLLTFNGVDVGSLRDFKEQVVAMQQAPQRSSMVLCMPAKLTFPPAVSDEWEDAFVFSGDKIANGWEQQEPLPLPPQKFNGLNVAVVLENFERQFTVLQYRHRLEKLWLNGTDLVMSYKPPPNMNLDMAFKIAAAQTAASASARTAARSPVVAAVHARAHGASWMPLSYVITPLAAFGMPPMPTTEKINKIAFFSSRCEPGYAPYRDSLIEALLKLMPDEIHSFGQCHNNADPAEVAGGLCQGKGYSWNTADHDSMKECVLYRYKFYFAFENSASPGYVTEKLWQGLKVGSVPVYWGAPDVDKYLPSRDSVINVDDYESMLELATYLRRALSDGSLYDRHLRWKRHAREDFSQGGKRKPAIKGLATRNDLSLQPGFVQAVRNGRSRLFCSLCDHIADTRSGR